MGDERMMWINADSLREAVEEEVQEWWSTYGVGDRPKRTLPENQLRSVSGGVLSRILDSATLNGG